MWPAYKYCIYHLFYHNYFKERFSTCMWSLIYRTISLELSQETNPIHCATLPVCHGFFHTLSFVWRTSHGKVFSFSISFISRRVLEIPHRGKFLSVLFGFITHPSVEGHKRNLVYLAEFVVLAQSKLFLFGKFCRGNTNLV